MDMSKYTKLFVSESQDHLQKMDGFLLALERDAGDRAAIDSLFREAHSLKGMSASMGFEELAKVSHKMEDFLDRFREGKGTLARAAIDLLFEGVDLLRTAVAQISQAQPPSLDAGPFLAKMSSELLAPREAPGAPAGPFGAMGADAETVEQAALWAGERGLRLYAVQIDIARDAPLPSARAYVTLKRMGDFGEVVRSNPSLEDLQVGRFSGSLAFLLASPRPRAELERALAAFPDVAQVRVEGAGPEPRATPAQPLEPAEVGRREPEPSLAPAAPGPAPSPAPAAAPAAGRAPRTGTMIRVEARLLDDLMDQVGELVTAKGSLVEHGQASGVRPLRESIGRIEQLVAGLQQQAMQLRMMPLELIADRFPRAVRDLARRGGKEVNFEIVGKEIELDRAILEELPDPLLHIFRNAIDHGIERPEDRVRSGKSPAGTLRLEAFKEKEGVVIRIMDDGRGMDPAVLRGMALERGLITREQHDALSDEEALALITIPGFSTATAVSDLSGRGVGMDVVRTTVESLRGALLIESLPGEGTVFTLKLPLTLAVVSVLLVRVGDERYAIPVSHVEQTLQVAPHEIQRSQGQEVVAREGVLVPLLRLDRALGARRAGPADGGPLHAILAEIRGRLVGVVVDGILGYRDAVVKPLGKALRGLRGFAGVTILGDGTMVLIIDLNTL